MRKIEKYFDYYWARDLNYAMKSESDQRFLSELPKEIRVNVILLIILLFHIHRSIKTFYSISISINSKLILSSEGSNPLLAIKRLDFTTGRIALTALS